MVDEVAGRDAPPAHTATADKAHPVEQQLGSGAAGKADEVGGGAQAESGDIKPSMANSDTSFPGNQGAPGSAASASVGAASSAPKEEQADAAQKPEQEVQGGMKLPEDQGSAEGTGTKHVTSTGLKADGGDFDARAPGAGAEAVRLMGHGGTGRTEEATSSQETKQAKQATGEEKKTLGDKLNLFKH